MGDSCVRVGVRIRPLSAMERHQGSVITSFDKDSIFFKDQTFTFDHVFGPELSQLQMYQTTASPMLKSFLEGYNVTIMAYGQTGSGKTYTMGTADSNANSEDASQGLLPRFVSDLFENLKELASTENIAYKVKVSFLEIYGEDVYDLTIDTAGRTLERPSLQVRENDQGLVFVQGLQDRDVDSAGQALNVLDQGTRNRTTGSTSMNAGSSRSHAVFTITLDQKVVSIDSDEDGQEMSSKLTFVDLAGSERLKRTGAQGQRMKEGIQINSGLFNLGQVINGLADDQRLKSGTKVLHIPYRNSKLTHLLKDALGGNSKTLFLACVSPAEINESETYSTLMYARQARNIQNKPVQNMDKTQLQLKRLKCTAKTWMIKALSLMFSDHVNRADRGIESVALCNSPLPRGVGLGQLSPVGRSSTGQYISLLGSQSKYDGAPSVGELLRRPDVQDYIRSVEEAINASLSQGPTQSPRKVRLSVLSCSPAASRAHLRQPSRENVQHQTRGDNEKLGNPKKLFYDDPATANSKTMSPKLSTTTYSDLLPEVETEKLVNRMLEIVSREKESVLSLNEDDAVRISSVEREIEEKEEILGKLMDTVKGYSVLKLEFEKLVDEINNLDAERRDLEIALERAQNSKRCDSSKTIDKLQDRFKKVNEELQQMRIDRSRKESAYKLMQRESKQCDQLEKELQALKANKVQLQRKQKEQAQLHLKFKKEQQVKIQQLKKSDVKKQQLMNNLKNELLKKQRVLGHRDRELARMQAKLKACEEHITQLLRIQSRSNSAGPGYCNRSASARGASSTPGKTGVATVDLADDSCRGSNSKYSFPHSLSAIDLEYYTSSKHVLDNLVLELIDRKELLICHEQKSRIVKELNDEIVVEGKEEASLRLKLKGLEEMYSTLLAEGSPEEASEVGVEIMETEQTIKGIQADIDIISREIDMHSADLSEIDLKMSRANGIITSAASWEELGKSIILGLTLPQCHMAIWELLTEKAETSATVSLLQQQLKQTTDMNTFQSDNTLQYERQLQALKEELHTKLQECERQRIHDVWAILKAQTGPDYSGERGCPITESAKDIRENAIILRAQELESALEACLLNEENLKVELEHYKRKNCVLEATIEEINMKKELGSGVEVLDGMDYFGSLKTIWDELGTPPALRIECLARIEDSRKSAKVEAVEMFQTELADAKQEEARLLQDISNFLKFLYLSPERSEDLQRRVNLSEGLSLLQRMHMLYAIHAELLSELRIRVKKIAELKIRAQSLSDQMILDNTDETFVSHGLNDLLKVPELPNIENACSSDQSLSVYFNNMLASEVAVSDDNLNTWTDGVRELSVRRANCVLRCENIRNEARATVALLGFLCKEDLMDLIDLNPLPDFIRSMAYGALFDSSDELHLMGSEKLIDALDRVNIGLKTIDVTRRSVMKSLHQIAFQWNETISFNGEDLTVSLGLENVSPSKEIVIDFISSLSTRVQKADQYVIGFQRMITAIMHELNLINEIQVRRELELDAAVLQKFNPQANSRLHMVSVASIENQSSCLAHLKCFYAINDVVDWVEKHICVMDVGIEELDEMSIFIEEKWMKSHLETFVRSWRISRSDVMKVMIRQNELYRLQALDIAIKDIKKLDAQLTKHIKEMEDFEILSKQNRSRVLSGNSKALIEEEKFRKTGKRKYESIIERLYAGFLNAQGIIFDTKFDLITSPILNLSNASQMAIKSNGKSIERIELMHLHTTTHGTKRWSGDLLDTEVVPTEPSMSSHAAAGVKSSSSITSPKAKCTHDFMISEKKNSSSSSNCQEGRNVFAECLAAYSSPVSSGSSKKKIQAKPLRKNLNLKDENVNDLN